MNFGTILNSMTKQCVKLMIESKDGESKNLVKDFIGYVHIKDPLKKQFRVYNQLNSSYIRDRESAKRFLDESIRSLSQFRFEDIQSYNALLEIRFNIPKTKTTDVNYHIANLIRYTTSEDRDSLIESYVNSYAFMVDHLMKIKEEKNEVEELDESLSHSSLLFLKPKHIVRIGLKKFNESYGKEFDDEDRKLFSILKENNSKKIFNLWESLLTEVRNLKDELESTFDDELRSKLDETLKLVSMEATQENILNLHEIAFELKELKKNG